MTRRKKSTEETEFAGDPMVPFLEEACKSVINDPDSTPADRVKAIEAGVRLQLAKYKTRATNDKSFFGASES